MENVTLQNLIKTLEPNTKGRDFVIGDLHGSYSAFLNLLEHIEFDGDVDRMISVGDLVDRGPDSLNCLRLIKETWFYCVRANHEEMMLGRFDNTYIGQFWFRNGGLWGLEIYEEYRKFKNTRAADPDAQMSPDLQEFMELLEILRELPLLITVQGLNGTKTHVIHAELPPNTVITDEDLADETTFYDLASTETVDGEFILWGRHKFYPFYNVVDLRESNKNNYIRDLKGLYPRCIQNNNLSPIISGHTILHKPMTIMGQTNIDTGAFHSYKNAQGDSKSWAGLTCVELNSWKFVQSTESEFRTVDPIVVNTLDIQVPKDNEND